LKAGRKALLLVFAVFAAAAAIAGITLIGSGKDDAAKTSTTSGKPVTTSTTMPSADLIWRADFDTNDFSQWEGVQEHSSTRATVVSSPHKQGRYAGRFEAREGEFTLKPDAPTRNRTEAVLSVDKNRHNPQEGDNWWYRWWIYIPSTLRLPTGKDTSYIITTQWLSIAGPVTSSGTFEIRNDTVNNSGWPKPSGPMLQYTTGGGDGRADGYEILWKKPMSEIPRNTWHKILLHRKWSSKEADGFSELWWDDASQTFFKGSNVPASLKTTRVHHRTIRKAGGVYFKQGIYRSNAIGGTAVIYLDGLRIAKTRAAADAE
jgi:hypothetical protein